MVNFMMDFPDVEILNTLGDTATVLNAGVTTEVIGRFNNDFEEDELGKIIDINSYSFITPIENLSLFNRDSAFTFNNVVYNYFKKIKLDDNLIEVTFTLD